MFTSYHIHLITWCLWTFRLQYNHWHWFIAGGGHQALSFDMCDRTRTRQHTRKPICACYLSHAWKVVFSRKGLVHRIFFFQSFVYVYKRHLWIMRYMSIAYRRRWLRWPEGRPKRKIGFVGFLRVGFQFRYFFENRPACTVYYFKC